MRQPGSDPDSPDGVPSNDDVLFEAITALSDEQIEHVVQQWRVTLDVASAFTRGEATRPGTIDRLHAKTGSGSQCVGGHKTLDELAGSGIHPRIAWRYCEDPTSLTVLAQPIDDDEPRYELQLWDGWAWIPLRPGDDGYLAAQTTNDIRDNLMLRLVERRRP